MDPRPARRPDSPKAKRRLRRIVLFAAIVVGACTLMLFARRPRRATGLSRVPAGGVASAEEAGTRAKTSTRFSGSIASLVEDARRYPVRTWSFALDRYEVRIEDAGFTTALDTVLAHVGADFVVNGGFFDREGKPVGLALSNGVVLSRHAKHLSGGVLASDGNRAELFPSESFALPDGGTFAIQCRPRLVVDRAANVKSDDGKRAERTALCTREEGLRVDVIVVHGSDDGESAGPSLFALARYLADAGCESALNLDGGPSTGVAWREDEKVELLAPRGPVRHVIAFRERR